MNSEFEVKVMSDQDYDDLIAEICFRGEAVALLTQEQGFASLDLQLLCRGDGKPWHFKFADFSETLSQAKARLWELRRGTS